MLFSHKHAFFAVIGVADDNGKAGVGVVMGASADPADDVGVVKIVFLLSVGVAAADLDHLAEVGDKRAVLNRISVVIGVEDAGGSALAQQDHGIGNGFEPVRDKGLEGLSILGVVVVYKGHGVIRSFPDKGVVKDPAQIIVAACL